ncbi:hypothetical protein ASF61_12905 [Duganella sp. Leaf126]|uniref:DUF3108 domain-containing protein n=1 Tax=Duganella sp. Leaf126 TaxID=1736266 RepID=UPI0006F46A5F|nr:DUF3108 domain-containing protein [Duganella sp. Leaf126]KQQ32981.1 hypothetical protein ASF61_12905 [Duganella sp. Leaf126]
MQITSTMRPLIAAAAACVALTATTLGSAHAADTDHPSVKRAFSAPPSADLNFAIKARQHGLTLNGTAAVQWRAGDGKYAIVAESRAPIFGKILDTRSEGVIDDYGLAPVAFMEKRFRKDPTTATFKRDTKTISFSVGDETYPIKGGEQDRVSIQWQLAANARAAPEKFKPGSEWAYFVTARRNAEQWVFKVVNTETITAGGSEISALHLVRLPLDGDDSKVDLWLAPTMDWYPVRVVFKDSDGDYVDQTLDKLTKK